jgi:hypothetical protein
VRCPYCKTDQRLEPTTELQRQQWPGPIGAYLCLFCDLFVDLEDAPPRNYKSPMPGVWTGERE